MNDLAVTAVDASRKIRTRAVSLRSSTLNIENRTVEAVLATENWINGHAGPERLRITQESVDLSRAESGLPWHDDHGQHVVGLFGSRVGKVSNVRIESGQLLGTLRASRNPEGEAALRDIEDNIITHVSIGFQVDRHEESGDGIEITQWTPLEVSTPSVVADINAMIQRRAASMSEDLNQPSEDEIDDPNIPVDEGAILQRERARAAAVDALFLPFLGQEVDGLRAQAVQESWSIETARARLLDHMGTRATPSDRVVHITAGTDSMEKFRDAAVQSLGFRGGALRGAEAAEAARNPLSGFTLRELARETLRVAGVRAPSNPMDLVGVALTRAGIISHSTSDFANILVDASNKALQVGWVEAPETYEPWTRPTSLTDFKVAHRAKLSSFSDLAEVPETGEVTYGSFSDFKETLQLKSYAKLFSISRKAIINDDLNAFMAAPTAMARAAKRGVADTVYAILTGNPTMSDSNSLWDATNHSNYVAAGSGAAPSVTTLNAAYTSMATQTDSANNVINVAAQYIIAPHALRGTVDALLASVNNPAEGTTTSFTQKNIWMASLIPIYDARLDADDAAKWYLAANPQQYDTVEVASLNGATEPRLEEASVITVDGVVMRVAHDWDAAPLDWRYLYHNDGN